ncbi:MAG TPA: AmmeMemoRadiSam system radical SAM enzyme [bacterium]
MSIELQEAVYYRKLHGKKVRCLLCPKLCVIKHAGKGYCTIRENIDGVLYAVGYGKVAAVHLDPIEKKPLYHFYPGSEILSIGTVGCNQRCLFCQNWSLVEGSLPSENFPPAEAVDAALRCNSIGIAYTYNEPLIWFEYVLDTAKLAKEKGLKNVLVTNGEINPRPLDELLPFIDAMNIDLKSMDADYYKKICDGNLMPVKKTIEKSIRKCHVEITNLLVAGKNDSDENISALVEYIAGLGRNIPLHFSRYFPNYKMHNQPTPMERLERAYSIAKGRLNYVYLGNVLDEKWNDTLCPSCGAILVSRRRDNVLVADLNKNRCRKCNSEIAIVS